MIHRQTKAELTFEVMSTFVKKNIQPTLTIFTGCIRNIFTYCCHFVKRTIFIVDTKQNCFQFTNNI